MFRATSNFEIVKSPAPNSVHRFSVSGGGLGGGGGTGGLASWCGGCHGGGASCRLLGRGTGNTSIQPTTSPDIGTVTWATRLKILHETACCR